MSTPEVVPQTVLVADDDALVRGVLRMVLMRDGFAVVEAGSAAETISAAETTHPALVVLDVNMPGGTVHETLSALRQQSPDLPVLILSGEAHPPAEFLGTHGDFARKPIELDDLLSRVHGLLALQRES
jgi:CheY-like chemotaxis protein